jgi:hypothetical protein
MVLAPQIDLLPAEVLEKIFTSLSNRGRTSWKIECFQLQWFPLCFEFAIFM